MTFMDTGMDAVLPTQNTKWGRILDAVLTATYGSKTETEAGVRAKRKMDNLVPGNCLMMVIERRENGIVLDFLPGPGGWEAEAAAVDAAPEVPVWEAEGRN